MDHLTRGLPGLWSLFLIDLRTQATLQGVEELLQGFEVVKRSSLASYCYTVWYHL